jgi:hypothetical protein
MVTAFALLVTTLAPAQGPSTTTIRRPTPAAVATASAMRAPQAPKIDGVSDDAIWQSAPRSTGFRTFEPTVDQEPKHRTEFQVAYDDRHLYVFVRMFDPAPDSIMTALSRRDQRGPSDQIKLIIDSYNDKRSGFEFAVNPVGVKRDFSMSNDGNEDASWDGIWDVGTLIDSLGWTAEFRIPLSQLRYANAESHEFGFGIWRDVERIKERSSWPIWRPTVSGISSQLGSLTGLRGLSTARRMEATPYFVTKNAQRPPATAGGAYTLKQTVTFGADLKLGLTPNITLDGTVNPDFGQVEADPAVVNLTAFETFNSERRPFFVEGSSTYQFALNCYIVVDCSTNEGLFYSRRIGRPPALRDLYGDQYTATATPIAAAAKITGRTGKGFSFGLLDAFTDNVPGTNGRVAEPATNYAAFRGQQDWNSGNTSLSLMGTAVNRTLDTLSEDWLHRGAYATGASFRHRFGDRKYEFNAQLAASAIQATSQVMAMTQTNSVHYYQQPGDDHSVDSTATSLTGTFGQLKFGKYSGGITRIETSVVGISSGFDVNDLGFLRRADKIDWSTWGALSWREAKWIYRWAQVNGNYWTNWNTSGTKLDNSLNFNGHMGLKNNWDIHLGGTFANVGTTWCDRCTRGGPVIRNSRGFFPWGGVNTDSRKKVYGGMWFNYGTGDEGNSHNYSLDPYLNFRLSTAFTANFGFGWSRNEDDNQFYRNIPTAGVTHHAFAHLDQRTVYASARVNYTATPNLTFEFYGQPFVSSGDWSDFREPSATPGAEKYADRYMPYVPPAGSDTAFKVRSLLTNAVVRWEYRPGSTLFVVWQHGRSGRTNVNNGQGWMNDYRELLDLHPNNTFVIKLAYWLNR